LSHHKTKIIVVSAATQHYIITNCTNANSKICHDVHSLQNVQHKSNLLGLEKLTCSMYELSKLWYHDMCVCVYGCTYTYNFWIY